MICKNCGAQLESNALFCINCGTKVAVESAPAAQAPVQQPAAAPAAQTPVQQPYTQQPPYCGVPNSAHQPVYAGAIPVPETNAVKKGANKKVIIIVGVIAVAALALVLIFTLGSGSRGRSDYQDIVNICCEALSAGDVDKIKQATYPELDDIADAYDPEMSFNQKYIYNNVREYSDHSISPVIRESFDMNQEEIASYTNSAPFKTPITAVKELQVGDQGELYLLLMQIEGKWYLIRYD